MRKPEKKDIPGPKADQPEVLTIPAGGGLGSAKPEEPVKEEDAE